MNGLELLLDNFKLNGWILDMKIRTQVIGALGLIVTLLIVVSIAGYGSSSVVNQAGSVIPNALIPGIQNYQELRYKTLDVVVAVYQKDANRIDQLSKELEPNVITFSSVQEDSPYYGDATLEKGLATIGATLLDVIYAAQAEDLSSPASENFLSVVETMESVGPYSEDVIQYLIDQTTNQIGAVISNIIRILLAISSISVLIAIALAFYLSRSIDHGIRGLRDSFSKISSGDLLTKADDKRKDELGEIAGYFNELAQNLKLTISQLATMMNTLAVLSTNFREGGIQFQDRAQQTSDETQQVATAMTEMAATIREVAQNAEQTSNQAIEATEQASTARSLVETSVNRSITLKTQMSGISEQILLLKDKTASISSVIDVIQGIAEQTNLLALNAAIEAARAGEQGRGFAVVADEVRTLANRTAQSTQEIVDVIKSLQNMSQETAQQIEAGQADVDNNADAIKDIETTLLAILENISSISSMNHQVATNSQEQSHVAEDMNINVVRISDLAEQNAVQTEQINKDIQTIDELTQQVKMLISRFKYE